MRNRFEDIVTGKGANKLGNVCSLHLLRNSAKAFVLLCYSNDNASRIRYAAMELCTEIY